MSHFGEVALERSSIPQDDKETVREEAIKWKSHPLTENTLKTVALFGVLAVVLYAIYFAFGSLYFVGLAAVVLFLSLMRYFVPTHYRADKRGISILFFGLSKFREWSSFRNVYLHSSGIHLAPFERPSALDSFRGIFLLFGKGDKNEIVQFVTRNIQQKNEKSPSGEVQGNINA